jgi:hypothetical protein
MQKFINTKLGGNDAVPVAFAVVGAIIHANGLHNNAFAGVLCGEPTKLKEPYAAKYLSSFNYPMQGGSTKQADDLPSSATKPAWVGATNPTVESVTSDTSYLQLIKKLFKVEIAVQPPLTKKKQNRRKKAKPGKRNGNKKTDGPKTQPRKKAAPQQGAKVGKPKKPVKLGSKDKKPKGKK